MHKHIVLMATLAALAGCTPDAPATGTDSADIIGPTQLKADRLTPELLHELGKVSDMQASPDGTRLLYGITYTSVAANKSNRELFVMDLPQSDGSGLDIHQITHTATSEQQAVWLDNARIAFLSAESGSTQIWTMQADGSARRQLSRTDRDIEGFKFSPDGQRVIVVMARPVERIDSALFEGLDKTTGRLWDEMNYRHWNTFVNDTPRPYLYDVKADGTLDDATARDILGDEPYECPDRPFGGMECFAWSPDSRHIVYTCRKETGTRYAFSTRTSPYLYDVAEGTTRDLHPGDHGYDTCPTYLDEGHLVFLSMARNGYESDRNRLMLLSLPGAEGLSDADGRIVDPAAAGAAPATASADGRFVDLTAAYDNSVNAYAIAPDATSITFTSYAYGTAQVFNLDIATCTITRLSAGDDHDYGSVCYAGGHLYTTRHDMHTPDEIYRLTPDGQTLQLTHVNTDLLSQLGDMGRIERRTMRCTNGDSMLVWVAYPAGFDEARRDNPQLRVPTLLYCQGGPESAVSQFWSTRWNVAIMQAHGYAVVLPNRHGVPGFGQAFNEQIAGDFAGQCMRDYFTAIDQISREPWCDADRLGAIGASFGGYSVYWLAGHHQKRFKALIAHCGIFNTESMYGETEEMWFADWDYGGPYFDAKALQPGLCHTPQRGKGINACYTDSPHRSVDKWDTPLLVIHNELDYRIPVTQGMQAFNIARMRGVPARFLYFPDECHWVSKPQNGVLWQRVFFDWLDRYLKPGAAARQ